MSKSLAVLFAAAVVLGAAPALAASQCHDTKSITCKAPKTHHCHARHCPVRARRNTSWNGGVGDPWSFSHR